MLADPVPRAVERVMARFGLIESAPPVFTACVRAPLAGLLLALPALAATRLAQTAHAVYGALPNGFYSLDTMLCEGVFRALLGAARAEGAARVDPVALGRVLGLDRAPEVKTIRRKIGLLAEAGKAGDWIAAMARRHVAARPEEAVVCYVDGHVRAYQGSRKIAKTHVPRMKFPAPATVETWVSDAAGDPLLVVMAEPAASLAGELRLLIPELRTLVGDDRRVLVGFDRGGWSPTLFADLHAAGFDTLTWRKGQTADIDDHAFAEHSHTDEHGRVHTWRLADTEVELGITEGPRQGEVFAMRQISLFESHRTRQMHILTTRGSGDIIPDHHTLHIRLDPLSAPRHTAALAELCHTLNDTHTNLFNDGQVIRVCSHDVLGAGSGSLALIPAAQLGSALRRLVSRVGAAGWEWLKRGLQSRKLVCPPATHVR